MKRNKIPLLASLLFVLLLFACRDSNSSDNPPGTPEDSSYLDEDINPTNLPDTAIGVKEDYENTNRVIWQKPDMIINLLGNIENKTVADIGAGTGFFALRLAPVAKKVIAIDVDPRFIEYLDSVKILELPETLQDHLETRLALPDDPKIGPREADIVMIVNTFMYIEDPISYLKNLKNSIAEGGKLLIIDFKRKRTPIGPPAEIRRPLYRVEEMLYETGYRNVSTNDTALDYQYIVMAQN